MTALFSDTEGGRTLPVVSSSHAPVPAPINVFADERRSFSRDDRGPDQDDAESQIADLAVIENDVPSDELSELRLDVIDIQEAIKNHDLWVQDVGLFMQFFRNGSSLRDAFFMF